MILSIFGHLFRSAETNLRELTRRLRLVKHLASTFDE